jgi:DNA (cytosine-5)-methyltransferase 1
LLFELNCSNYRPTQKYTPWFRTVLKAARVAVFTLGLLSAESRASRLSFADVVKRIAEQPEGSPAYVGKKVSLTPVS